MEVRVYEPTGLLLQAIIENFTSLIWHRKYSAAGKFEFHVPATDYNIAVLPLGNIISFAGAAEAGVIEDIKIEQNNKKNELTVKGRFLESYFDRRLIYGTNTASYNFSGLVETGMRELVVNAAPIPLLELGEVQGFTECVTFQATYQNLLKYESQLADSIGIGFRCSPDFVNHKIIFNLYRGLDHSINQSERVRVVFSEEYKNINRAVYKENDQLLKTVCYVGGQGEGSERVWVVVGDDTLTGLERREVRLDAADIDPTDLTEVEYEAKLAQRGEQLLANDDIMVDSFECDTIPTGNFVYKNHWNLGDIVTLQRESWGLSKNIRITEITEAYEHGKATITPTFGSPLPDTIDWEDK